jgi:LysM repeat protein
MPKFRRSRALLVGSALVLLIGLTSLDYTVRSGDTLGEIARDHGVSVSDIAAANSLSNPDLILPGQVLVIPGKTTDIMHVVARGDTLGRIAGKYGSSVSSIVSANNIRNPNLILIGQELLVPNATSPSAGTGTNTISDRTGQYHIVKRGETVKQIAAQYSGVTVDDLVRANGIVDNVIYAGSALYLSGPGYVASGTAGEISYTVRQGDRLGDIAHAHGVRVSSIVSINGIKNPDLIRSGQVLGIPTGTAWMCPVVGAHFRNDWGFPRGGGARYHEGNDLFAARGTPVRAPVGGTVEHVTGSIGGNQFRLHGADGVKYIGSHMDEFGKDGKVRAGDVIGYVGNTGNAKGTSTHLHFGMYYKGAVVNPYPTLIAHGCK